MTKSINTAVCVLVCLCVYLSQSLSKSFRTPAIPVREVPLGCPIQMYSGNTMERLNLKGHVSSCVKYHYHFILLTVPFLNISWYEAPNEQKYLWQNIFCILPWLTKLMRERVTGLHMHGPRREDPNSMRRFFFSDRNYWIERVNIKHVHMT